MTLEASGRESYDRIFATAEVVNSHLKNIYDGDLHQAKVWVILTSIAGSLAFLALLGIVIAISAGYTSVAVATGAFHLLADAFTAFLGKQLLDANKQVLNDREKL